VNRLVAWILRSPFSSLLDKSVMLISVKGRRTGREYTLPVNYADDGDRIWVIPGNPERKTWWRNLDAETPVRLRFQGTDLVGTARAFRGGTDPATVEAGFRVYLRRFPRSARAFGIENGEAGVADSHIEEAARLMVIVRIVPNRNLEAETPGARGPAGD